MSALPPESGYWLSVPGCPLCAKSGHWQLLDPFSAMAMRPLRGVFDNLEVNPERHHDDRRSCIFLLT